MSQKRVGKGSREGGQFASMDSIRGRATVDLDYGNEDFTEYQQKFSTAHYTPHDPDRPRVADRLAELDDEPAATHDQFGNELGRGGFPRDRWGRAMVTDTNWDPNSGKRPKMVSYKAPSSMSVASFSGALDAWKQDNISRAFVRNPHFAEWAQEQYDNVDPSEPEWTEKAVLKRVREEAEAVSNKDIGAERGTYLHWVSEQDQKGRDWRRGAAVGESVGISEEATEAYHAEYRRVLDQHGIDVLQSEQSVVGDRFRTAGTTDMLVELQKPMAFRDPNGTSRTIPAGTRMIADIKTGSMHRDHKGNPKYREGYTTQASMYADSTPYDPVTGQRSEWPDGRPPSQDYALILNCSSESVIQGKPEMTVEVLNLYWGREHAESSSRLRDTEKAVGKASVNVPG